MFEPPWEQIRLFLAVMRARTLVGAGRRVGLDASNVSRRLARLEEELGAPLFDRTRDGLVPTSAAEHLLPHAEEVELAVAHFASAGNQVETTVEGLVRITAPPGVADTFVAPLLPLLLARYPSLLIELDASVSYADLTRREADLALRTVRPQSGELLVIQVAATHELPLTSPDYAASLGTLQAFSDARWLGWGDQLAHLAGSRWLGAHAPNLVPVLRSNHAASLIAAARAGLGLVLLPAPYTRLGLVPVTPGEALTTAWADLPATELWLVAHRAQRHVPRVAAVWDFLLDQLGGGV